MMRATVAVLMLLSPWLLGWTTSDDRDAFRKNITDLGPPNGALPGEVLAFGQDAFVVASMGKKGNRRGVIAAARGGKGRVVAFGHGAFLGGWEAEGFLVNALEWATRKALDKQRVLLVGESRLQESLEDRVRSLTQRDKLPSALNQVDCVLWIDGDLDEDNLEELEAYVREGGALFFGTCPWGVQQIWDGQGHGRSIHTDLPVNALARRFGLVFGEATVGGRGYVLDPKLNDVVHAGDALGRVLKVLEGSRGDSRTGDPARVAALLRALPPDDERFRPAIVKALSKAKLDKHVPGERKPIPATDAVGYIGMLLAIATWNEASAEDVPPAPGYEFFPGKPDGRAPRLERELRFGGELVEKGGWLSTGLYAPAGEVVEIEISSDVAENWNVRIGAHKDELWHKDKWNRWPQVTLERPIAQLEQERGRYKVASAFGGLLYFVPRKGAEEVEFRVRGVVEAPYFVLEDPQSAKQWKRRRKAPAPWGELACDGIIMTLPSGALRKLDDPVELMSWWKEAMQCYPELRGEPQPMRPERLVEDLQISAGWMHSGYPVMTHGADDIENSAAVEFKTLSTEGNWGYFHEFGHNAQKSDWTFSGTGEVTCNLFSLYLGERMAGIEPWENSWLQGQKKLPAKYFEGGSDFDEWKSSPGLALMMYAEIQREFGWDPFKQALAAYLELSKDERPKSDLEKHDRWLVEISRATERDLGPYFEKWGMPTTPEARDSVAKFERWMPADY